MERNPGGLSRFAWFALVAALMASAAGGIWFYRLQQQAMRNETEKDLAAIARIKADQIMAWRKDQLADADLHEHPFMLDGVARFLAAPTENNRRDLRTRFRTLARQHDYTDVLLVDPDGSLRLSLSDSAALHRGYLPAVAVALRERRPVFVDLHIEKDTSSPHISVVTPLSAIDANVRNPPGALVLIADASQFLFPLVQSWPTPSRTAETLLVRREDDHVLFLNNLRHRPGTALNLRIPLSRADLPAVMAVKGEKGFVQGKDYRGADVAAVILPIPESPWFMVSKINAEEAFADWRSRSFLLLAMIFGWTALVGVVGLVFWQRAKKDHFRALYRSEADLRAQMERHSVTLKAVGDAVIATDARGRVELLNPVAESLTGWRQDEAGGKALGEVFHIINARTRIKAENPVTRVLREGLVVGLANHTILVSKDGTEYQIADSAAPITDSAGNINGVVMVFRNVTREYAMQQALVDAERYYRSLIHSLHEDILVIDRDYRVTDINNSALQTLGLNRGQALGRQCYELSHGLDAPCHMHGEECGLCHVLETGTGCNLHHEHVDADGNRHHVDILTSPLKDQDGNITHVIEAVRDVTDLFKSRKSATESETRFRQLFERSANAVFLVDTRTGKYLDANAAALHLAGRSLEALKTLTVKDVTPEGAENRLSALAKGARNLGEVVYLRPDGSQRIALLSAVPLENGQAFGIAVDITDRKQAEEERARLTSAVEQASEMFVITDIDGSIRYVNPAFEKITGYTLAEVLGQNPRILKSGEQDDAFYAGLWQTILSGGTWQGQMTNRKKDGSFFVETAAISPVLDQVGQIVNFVAVKSDITAQIRAEQKLKESEETFQARLQQAQKMEAIGTLAGGIAHDFNNILFPIIGMSEMLLEDLPSGTPEHENVQEILTAGKRGSDLVRQILAFSRQSEEKKIPVRIQQVLKEVIKMVRATIPSSIHISHQIQPDCGLVMADPTQIHQVAMNLVTNAYHSVEPIDGKITVHLKDTVLAPEDVTGRQIEAGTYAVLSISDNGCGIAPGNMGKIFDPYFTTKEQGKGTGIGLSTVYGIVKDHGGDIQVYSELGMGTTFHIYLPLMGKSPDAVSVKEVEILPSGKERILVVDDENAIVRIEKQMLERLGYRVTARVSSLEALAAFKAAPGAYDLVITDMTMPNMTGDRLARELIAIRPDIPLIICTGFSDKLNPDSAKAMGIRGFLMKPVVRAEMATLVRNVLDAVDTHGPEVKNVTI